MQKTEKDRNEDTDMSAVNLGIETDYLFISDLLNDDYTQQVYETETYYSIKCENVNGTRSLNFDRFYDAVKDRYGDRLMEVYSITSDGVKFVVYIRK